MAKVVLTDAAPINEPTSRQVRERQLSVLTSSNALAYYNLRDNKSSIALAQNPEFHQRTKPLHPTATFTR